MASELVLEIVEKWNVNHVVKAGNNFSTEKAEALCHQL